MAEGLAELREFGVADDQTSADSYQRQRSNSLESAILPLQLLQPFE
jgi:hypothetical protein